jgi:hypothetical protein
MNGRMPSQFGWFMAAAALLCGVGAVLVRDDAETAGVALMATLWFVTSAALYVGAPYAREGRPSGWRIAVLFVAALSGVVAVAAVDWIVVLSVLWASYAIGRLAVARWPPEPGEHPVPRPAVGFIVAAFGPLLAFAALLAIIADVTDARGLQLALGAVVAVVMMQSLMRIRAVYVGRPAARMVRVGVRGRRDTF